MMSPSDLDARLRLHHEELVRLFSEHRLAGPGRARRRRSRPLVVGLVVAVAIAIAAPVLTWRLGSDRTREHQVLLAGFTITASAYDTVAPRMTRDEAIVAAESFYASHPVTLPHGGPQVSGLAVKGAWFVANVSHVTGPCVNVFLHSQTNLWLVAVSAPAQSGWSELRGGYLVNDATSSVTGADLLVSLVQHGPPAC